MTPEEEEQPHLIVDEDERDASPLSLSHEVLLSTTLHNARDALLEALVVNQGDYNTDQFRDALEPLQQHYANLGMDVRQTSPEQGLWWTLTKPSFFGNLGKNDAGDPMYTLGRMAFDMFQPAQLVCSLQGNFNSISSVSERQAAALIAADQVPKSLLADVQDSASTGVLRTYKYVVRRFYLVCKCSCVS